MNQETNTYGLNEFDDCEDDEIEIARKAGFGFLEERYEDDLDNQSIIDKRGAGVTWLLYWQIKYYPCCSSA